VAVWLPALECQPESLAAIVTVRAALGPASPRISAVTDSRRNGSTRIDIGFPSQVMARRNTNHWTDRLEEENPKT
jgi:hypothetical protein